MTQEELKLLYKLQSKAKGLLPDAQFVEVYQHDPWGLEDTNNYRLCGYHFDNKGMYKHFFLLDDGSIKEEEKEKWQDCGKPY